jgi:hypothetical protein
MLRAFIDDSGINQPPIYVLGGWVASASVWSAFSDDWQHGLDAFRRIERFKFEEAIGRSGEFHGMDDETRRMKLSVFVDIMRRHRLFGAVVLMPHDPFRRLFGDNSSFDRMRHPYTPMFHRLILTIAKYFQIKKPTSSIEFVFDFQPGGNQMQKLEDFWPSFYASLPKSFRELISSTPPSFRDDRDAVALQAADFLVGWHRHREIAHLTGRKIEIPWNAGRPSEHDAEINVHIITESDLLSLNNLLARNANRRM